MKRLKKLKNVEKVGGDAGKAREEIDKIRILPQLTTVRGSLPREKK